MISNHPDVSSIADHQQGIHAQRILNAQNEDGTWGMMFHSLARPDGKHPLTTEQALRRLYALGFTCNDAPIQKTLRTLSDCLQGKRKIDEFSEKGHDWKHFTRTMLSAWVRRFGMKEAYAEICSVRWAFVMEEAFHGGSFQQARYLAAYRYVLSSTEESSRALQNGFRRS